MTKEAMIYRINEIDAELEKLQRQVDGLISEQSELYYRTKYSHLLNGATIGNKVIYNRYGVEREGIITNIHAREVACSVFIDLTRNGCKTGDVVCVSIEYVKPITKQEK